ncbi:MAG: hypothetical protein R3195_03915 [Gemmatimonadota bacterium]|nr:hypothetical protein [Gemmatimonadota bacterium]
MRGTHGIGVAGVLAAVATLSAIEGARSADALGQEIELGPPTAARAEPFGFIGGLRELSDGSVLVADPLGGELVRLDPTLTSARKLGSEGEGPGEYRQPDSVWPIGPDRSLLVDLGNARLSEIGPDGSIGEGHPIARPSDGEGMAGMMLAVPSASDLDGHVYFRGSGMGPDGPRDTLDVFRLDLATGDAVRIAGVKGPELSVDNRGGENISISRVPLGPEDAWGVAGDGTVFIARVGDFSMEVVSPDGSVRRGDPIDYRSVRIGTDEKLEWAEERARVGGIMVDIALDGSGARRTQMSRATGMRREIEGQSWPDAMPPFATGVIRVDSLGRAWLRRSVAAGRPVTYDLFDRTGARVATVPLPEGRSLVAFGAGVVYLARTDEFDQQFLERYELP